MKRYIFIILLILAIAGIADAGYLTYEHYAHAVPTCTINRFLPMFSDCGAVLRSKYSLIFGIPLALLGLIHYFILASVLALAIISNKKFWWFWVLIEATAGAFASVYFMYLQIGIIGKLCLYCTLSALISFIIFTFAILWMEMERKALFIYISGFVYQHFLKSIFFLIDPEVVHVSMVGMGELMGTFSLKRKLITAFLKIQNKKLEQNIASIHFANPVGLSAGFDYEVRLTQILPSIGFGFETVGTITNSSYEGNTRPMLGRLPKSKSLMVNKGFKNLGAGETMRRMSRLHFEMPVGISIGRTNGKKNMTQKQSVEDVVRAFTLFEKSRVRHSYYELNISCPNLYGNISFYPSQNLKQLLSEVQKLKISRPVFVKMPIEKSDKEVKEMLKIISEFSFIKGVIFGNLQKDRKDPSLDPEEVKKFKVGYFSGKPTERRSNELIKLSYRLYKKRFIIIGCGGIFSAKDAYKKIRLGASLVQLITGMIYQGPGLIGQINLELLDLLKRDGLKHISEAIGRDS
ncbi:quinone-dependent dihydroorotate dehydrogenase [Candidatus Roizmanbacteria bacterium]|nr:quinone-dependent dihydroorotate dehydrogenase [Candidatus Roizmanbacteria bacterium]